MKYEDIYYWDRGREKPKKKYKYKLHKNPCSTYNKTVMLK